jgi:hypothetical protein
MHFSMCRYIGNGLVSALRYLIDKRRSFRRPSWRRLRRVFVAMLISVVITVGLQMLSEYLSHWLPCQPNNATASERNALSDPA